MSAHEESRWLLVIATLFCAASASTGLAQPGGKEIVTDRPDIAESATVVPKARLQAKNGLTSTNDHLDNSVAICSLAIETTRQRSELLLETDRNIANPGRSQSSGHTQRI